MSACQCYLKDIHQSHIHERNHLAYGTVEQLKNEKKCFMCVVYGIVYGVSISSELRVFCLRLTRTQLKYQEQAMKWGRYQAKHNREQSLV